MKLARLPALFRGAAAGWQGAGQTRDASGKACSTGRAICGKRFHSLAKSQVRDSIHSADVAFFLCEFF